MNAREEQVRALIAQQAGDWFVAHRASTLGMGERKAFDEWLLASPVHVEEYLGVAQIAGVLPTAADDPAHPLEAILERVRNSGEDAVIPIGTPEERDPATESPARFWTRWQFAAVAGSLLIIVASAFFWWRGDFVRPEHYATQHGEQRTWRLADNSVLRLNTDTAVTVRYARAERLVEIDHGEALFEVAHDSARRFRVIAGTAEVIAVGTQFDVYCQGNSTIVTVVQGQVEVGAAESTASAMTNVPRPIVRVSAGEQVRVTGGVVPDEATPVDVKSSTAWLRRQIVFQQEPLAAVAAEFNRYGAVPIEIEAPALRELAISGVFAADDTASFIAFLRTLDGVKVEMTPTRIRVLARSPETPPARPR